MMKLEALIQSLMCYLNFLKRGTIMNSLANCTLFKRWVQGLDKTKF